MKLGLDLDSTITAAPDTFRALAGAVKADGGTVHIIHGDPTGDDPTGAIARARLATAGMDGLYDSVDVAGSPVAKTKAQIAKRLGVDLFIDNRKKNARRVHEAGVPSARFLK